MKFLRNLFWIISIIILFEPSVTIKEFTYGGIVLQYQKGGVQVITFLLIYIVISVVYLLMAYIEFNDLYKYNYSILKLANETLRQEREVIQSKLDELEFN